LPLTPAAALRWIDRCADLCCIPQAHRHRDCFSRPSCSTAQRGARRLGESAALKLHNLCTRHANDAPHPFDVVSWQDASFTSHEFVSSNACKKVGAGVPLPAIQRLSRCELLLSDFNLINSGKCSIHPATHDVSPDAVSTSARRYLPPCSAYDLHTLTCVTRASLSQVQFDARWPAAKPQDGTRHRLESYFDCLRKSRDSRGRRGAQDASDCVALSHARVRASLSRACSRERLFESPIVFGTVGTLGLR